MSTWTRWLSSLGSHDTPALPSPPAIELEEARQQAIASLADCRGSESERLRWRLRQAASAQELWLLRAAIFQQVACQHCQSQAAERIRALEPAFVRLR
ncbi:hypothetical protein [Ramlibacter sp.]|uniref:hypothetical protein n=1 Tax=Ramlibacter sp. TaxID=1917967 RepID=UPI0035ADF0DB